MEEKQFCRFCGESIAADAVICPKCGRALRNEPKKVKKQVEDSKSVGFAFLCFLVPPLGLILYLMWKKDRPLIAGSCRKGALIGLICWIIGVVILVAVKPNVPRELLGVWKNDRGDEEFSFYSNGILRRKISHSNYYGESMNNFRIEGNNLYFSVLKVRSYPKEFQKYQGIIKLLTLCLTDWYYGYGGGILKNLKWRDYPNDNREIKWIFEIRGKKLYIYYDSEGDRLKFSSYSKVGR